MVAMVLLLGSVLRMQVLSAGAPQAAPAAAAQRQRARASTLQPLPGGVTCQHALTISVVNDVAGDTIETPVHAVQAGGTEPMCWCSDDYVRSCH